MLFAKFVALSVFLGISSFPVLAAPPPLAHRGCGNVATDAQVLKAEKNWRARKVAASASVSLKADQGPIKVFWHVITDGSTGDVSDAQIADQIGVINAAYASTGVSYELAETFRVDNATLFHKVGPENVYQTEMKESLRQGGAYDLNVYSVAFDDDENYGLLGYATFPWDYEGAPKDDGVVIHYDSIPGGTFEPYNEGQTLTHEIGHWVGLWHTFQGGCGSVGDSVADTPAESSPAYGCPVNRDSCPTIPGLDPIHNFMDYSDDACMTEFTPGQAERLNSAIATYRTVAAPEPEVPEPEPETPAPEPEVPTPETEAPEGETEEA